MAVDGRTASFKRSMVEALCHIFPENEGERFYLQVACMLVEASPHEEFILALDKVLHPDRFNWHVDPFGEDQRLEVA